MIPDEHAAEAVCQVRGDTDDSTIDERDELLEVFLINAYPTRTSQDN